MKKRLLLFVMAAVLLSTAFCVPAYAEDFSEFAGTYEGWYYAAQGQTGLTLTINADGTGVFDFYNMPGRSNAKDGVYSVKVSRTEKGYGVEGVEWIDRPSGYNFVSFDGSLSGGVYSGNVDKSSSMEFMLTKNNAVYQQIVDTTYQNHRYEAVDEGMTWQDAKAACEARGGHLVTITSQDEQTFVEGIIINKSKNGYWIGGEDKDGGYEWITGEPMVYENWDTDQPDKSLQPSGYEDKMMMLRVPNGSASEPGRWNDIVNEGADGLGSYSYKAANMGYICEWETWTEAAEWSTPELQKAADNGLIPDVLVGKDMTKPITRGEFAAVSVNLFEAMTGGKAVMSSECRFSDISDNENRNYILKAYNIGAVTGYSDVQYAPDELLQREQLAAMLCRVYKRSEWPEWTIDTDDQYTINYSGVKKFDDDAFISDYAKPSVYFMVKYGVLSGIGDNKFAPKNATPADEAAGYANATREQAIVMSLRSFENLSIN